MEINNETNDEPTTYLNTRYVTAPEAIFRLFEFPLGKMSHSIQRLQVHLPNEEIIIYEAGKEKDALKNGK